MAGNTALDAALNAQFLVQIGVFTAVPMIMGFILELGLLKVSLLVKNVITVIVPDAFRKFYISLAVFVFCIFILAFFSPKF